jgi:peptide/nickel transport system permease protein
VGAYIAGRLLLALVALAGLTVITFVVSHAVPADPLVANLGQQASQRPEIVAAFRAKWGLDQPLQTQYLRFLRGLVVGDLGVSINTRRPVNRDLAQFLPATVELSTVAIVFAVAVGLPLGVLSAIYRDSPVDHLARMVSLIGVSIPIFWLATVSLVVFYWALGIAPGPGRLGSGVAAPRPLTGFYLIDSLLAGDPRTFGNALGHLILPALVLSSSIMGLVTRVTRSSMLEVLSQDFMRTARAKGVAERVVVIRHALRNALIPTVTILGLAYGGLLSGAVMTETIFAWPGLGRLVVEAIAARDYPLVEGCVLAIGLVHVAVNTVTDLLHGALDPRLRHAS